MSNQITTAFVNQYSTNVAMLLQQKDSRFRQAVMTSTAVGHQASPVDQVGSVTAQKKVSRHADTPLIETPHARRWCIPCDYEWADLIDQQDRLRTLIDPQSPYAQNGAAAIRRAIDDEVIAAATATAKTGQDGTGTEAFDTTNFQIAAGGTSLTITKLKTAKRKFMAAHVDVDMDPLFCAISAQEHEALLGETQAISLDYTNRPVLVDGRIRSFMGFNFIDSERLTNDGTNRSCFAWAKSGMHLCVWNDIVTDIGPRRDKSNATQVYVAATIGATRVEQGKVVNILCTM